MKRVVALVALLVLVVAGCRGDDGPGENQARLELDGSATVTRVGGEVETVTDAVTLDLGDVVRIDGGTGSLTFADDSRYELRAGDPGSEVEIAVPPRLLAGDALVVGDRATRIQVGDGSLTAMGVLLVDADAGSATALTGRTSLAGLGDTTELRALRSVLLSPAVAPRPLEYDGGDEWMRRYLGEAIAFGDRLESLARGYTGDLQPGSRSASFYEAVLPALAGEREFGAELLDDDREPGETLVGAAIAVQGREGAFAIRWDEVFTFRDEGAAWGLVALDQNVSSAPLLETIELAITESPLSDQPRPSTTTTRPPPTTAPPTDTTDPPPTTTPPPPTTEPPPPDPGDDPGGILTPVLDPVREVLDEVLDTLGLGPVLDQLLGGDPDAP